MWFSDFAEEKERRMVHDQRGINAPEYTLWALLHDRATVSRAGLIFYSIRQDIFGIGKTGGFMEAIA